MRILSGIQPSGALHIGNYFGMMRPAIELQEQGEAYYFIADYHSLTSITDPEARRKHSLDVALDFLACGLDPANSVFFRQSDVPEVTELTWLLGSVTPMGLLERCHSYKDKQAKGIPANFGLFAYPVLMAADIILYDAHEVPVGDDQKQHVELARDIAQRFNHLYGETFVVPEPVIPEVGARVMSLDNPTVKMAKTYSHVRGHLVRMLEEPAEIERSFRRAVTDSGNDIHFSDAPEKAGINNLLSIYKVVTGRSNAEVEADFADARGYGDLKTRVAEVVIEDLAPVRERYNVLMDDVAELDRLLARGAEQARAVSGPKLKEVKRRVGLVLPGS